MCLAFKSATNTLRKWAQSQEEYVFNVGFGKFLGEALWDLDEETLKGAIHKFCFDNMNDMNPWEGVCDSAWILLLWSYFIVGS